MDFSVTLWGFLTFSISVGIFKTLPKSLWGVSESPLHRSQVKAHKMLQVLLILVPLWSQSIFCLSRDSCFLNVCTRVTKRYFLRCIKGPRAHCGVYWGGLSELRSSVFCVFSPALTFPALGFVRGGFFLCKWKSADCTSGTYLRYAAHHGKTQILLYTCVLCCRYLLLCELSIFVITCGLPSLTNYGNKAGDIQKRSLICTTSANLWM